MKLDERRFPKKFPISDISGDTTSDRAMIVFGTNNWDDSRQSRQHIAAGFASRGWRVTYSTGPHHIWDLSALKWRKAGWRGRTGRSDGVILDYPGRGLLRWHKFPTWDGSICRRYVEQLVRRAGWHDTSTRVAYVFHPGFRPYIDNLGDCFVVYHPDDSFSKMPDPEPTLAHDESAMVERADLIVASSRGVAENLPGKGPDRAIVQENGADLERFATGPRDDCPADLAAIPEPRIGYSGALNPKIDFELLAALASVRPAWQWVLIGQLVEPAIAADPASHRGIERLKAMPNVHFLGVRDYRDMPRYQANVDVNMLCHRTDPGGWWEDLSPLKLYEYLAVGRPVVAASLPVLTPLRDVLAIATTKDEWLSSLDTAVNGSGVGTPETRRAAASGHDWGTIISHLEKLIVRGLMRRGRDFL